MQCSCGATTATARQTKNNDKHVLEYQRCDCGRQGMYVYFWNGEAYSRGITACQDFMLAGSNNG